MSQPHSKENTKEKNESPLKKKMEAFHALQELVEKKYSTPSKTFSFPPVTPTPIREALAKYTFRQPIPLTEVLNETSELLQKWNLDTSHPGYLGLFNGPAHFSSVVADGLVAAYNPQLSAWSHGAAANEIELHVIQFFLKEFGLDPRLGFGHFTSGGSESNTTAILCALNKAFPTYKKEGLISLKRRPLLYVSEYAHHSFQKTVCAIGLGLDCLRVVPSDGQLRMDTRKLQEMLSKDLKDSQYFPFCVVGTAGTTSAGIVDPLEEIARISASLGLWFHVDAAWGGAAIFSRTLKHHLAGIEKSDSITFDAHKWMAVSMGAGVFLCKDKTSLEEAFQVHADYMPELVPNTHDLHRTSLQWSRRAIGLKVFMALAELGTSGFEEQIDRQTRVAHFMRDELKRQGWKILNNTPLPVICFTHALIQEGKIKTKDVLKQIYDQKHFWISETRIRNQKVFRACITHPQTSEMEIKSLIQELNQILGRSP